ncbi:hypothetical protein [Parablautia intestinalis]|uniref:hypothetical protein n=1 Tax=Parablautia intestinalis TaxID=2320100 RepID=UPI00259CD98E|nr:hypothetical protein [Parablautia intestinalis]
MRLEERRQNCLHLINDMRRRIRRIAMQKRCYEEMYSNWKNKVTEAAGRDDVYSSFMNLLSLQWMSSLRL